MGKVQPKKQPLASSSITRRASAKGRGLGTGLVAKPASTGALPKNAPHALMNHALHLGDAFLHRAVRFWQTVGDDTVDTNVP